MDIRSLRGVFVTAYGIDKRPVDVIEDDLYWVIGDKLERIFISGEGKLVSCSNSKHAIKRWFLSS